MCHSSMVADPEAFAIVANNVFSFALPTSFSRKDTTSPTQTDFQTLLRGRVPPVVHNTLLRIVPRCVPINARILFEYVRDGYIPPFVVNYFMAIQEPSRSLAVVTRYHRALHLMETYRGDYFAHHPPSDDPRSPEQTPPRLPQAALDHFYKCVQACLSHMIATGSFDPVGVDQAAVFLEEMRKAVSGSSTASQADSKQAEQQPATSDARQPAKDESGPATPAASVASVPSATRFSVDDVLRQHQLAKKKASGASSEPSAGSKTTTGTTSSSGTSRGPTPSSGTSQGPTPSSGTSQAPPPASGTSQAPPPASGTTPAPPAASGTTPAPVGPSKAASTDQTTPKEKEKKDPEDPKT